MNSSTREKFIFTADIHLKMWNDKKSNDDGIPLRLIETIDTIDHMCNYALNNDIPKLVIGGDINDLKNTIHTRAFDYFRRKVLLKYRSIHFVLLHGNHDIGSNVENESSINLLSGYGNVSSITEPFFTDNIMYIPHSKNIINHIENSSPADILISHFGLSDAHLASGISLKTNISMGDLSKFKLVLLGHYHTPQKIENDTTKLYYVGSPIPLRRDEHGETKRFLVIDPDDLSVESVETKGYRKYYNFIIDESSKSNLKTMLENIEKRKKEGHHVIVRNKLKEVPKELDTSKEDIVLLDEYEEEYEIRGITSNMQIKDQMKKWLEIENVPERDRKKYMKVGLKAIGGNQ